MHQPHRFARHLAQALLVLSAATLAGPVFSATPAADQGNAASAQSPSQSQQQYQAAIASPARSDDDRKGDAKRKPAEFLAFAKVRPGMLVLDMATGGGATAALLALAVGPSGTVWAQSYKPSLTLNERLAAKPMPNLRPVVTPFDNPVAPGTPALDLITINLNYHDIVNTPTDRAAMNRRLFDALKPGGALVVIDNAAAKGSALTATKTLHRIEEAAVVAEVTSAGFVLDARSDYLHVAADPRDQPFFKMDGKPDDKFALRFVKK
ncbi:MAG: class I SAM-dependent methyltransferase [Massilia sp.]|nr:class I SAM-dependent methyltransferase [Massilia sp.]